MVDIVFRGKFVDQESIPAKTNDSTSGESFYQSYVYDESLPIRRPYFADHHGSVRGLYGKVDTSGYVVLPKRNFIVPIPQIDTFGVIEEDEPPPQPLVLTMVRDCFVELSRYYRTLRERGKVSTNSVISSLQPVNSWYSLEPDYFSYFSDLLKDFNRRNVANDMILEYSDYEKIMLKELDMLTDLSKPVTFSEYIISSSPLSSGLFIEVFDGSYSDDAEKYNGFIRDKNFEVFRRSAKRFGFKVDKNIPWRIFLDFSSPYTKEKMKALGMNSPQEFFAFYYDKACVPDCLNMQRNFRVAYEDFYTMAPSFSSFSCGDKVKNRIPYKQVPPSNSHFLKLYMYLRARETKRLWSQNKFDARVRAATVFESQRGIEQAIIRAESNFTDRSSEVFSKQALTTRNNFDILRHNASRGTKFDY